MKRNYMWLLLFFAHISSVQAVTLVYNLRIRRAFLLPTQLKEKLGDIRFLFTSVPTVFSRRASIITQEDLNVFEDRKAGGSLFNLRYIPKSRHWWLDFTSAILRDRGSFTGSDCFSAARTGIDDIVVDGGYRHFFGKRAQLIGYGLVGFPTKISVDREDRFGPLVGSRFFNLGFGIEASYALIQNVRRALNIIGQTRFIHGFTRSWDPIFPCGSKLQPGQFSDFFCAFLYREKTALMQTGYDLTVFSNLAFKLPDETIKVDTFIRHSWYMAVQYVFLNGFLEKPTIFGAGVSVSKASRFNARSVIGYLTITQAF